MKHVACSLEYILRAECPYYLLPTTYYPKGPHVLY